jgi:hypothetical protein
VLRAVPCLAPWRVAMQPRAAATWELPPGACDVHGVRPGARLHVAVHAAAATTAVRGEAGSGRRRGLGR